MSSKMNPEVKAQWVAALRSGDYVQGRETLRATHSDGTETFCCLGVMCDLYAQSHGLGKWELSLLEQAEAALPNDRVAEWAEMTCVNNDPLVVIGGARLAISVHNDNGRTFAEIADAIEAQL